MVGGVTCGYCDSGRLNAAIAPARVMTMDRTEAKIGRSMKKRGIIRNAELGTRSSERRGPRSRDPEGSGPAGLLLLLERGGGFGVLPQQADRLAVGPHLLHPGD